MTGSTTATPTAVSAPSAQKSHSSHTSRDSSHVRDNVIPLFDAGQATPCSSDLWFQSVPVSAAHVSAAATVVIAVFTALLFFKDPQPAAVAPLATTAVTHVATAWPPAPEVRTAPRPATRSALLTSRRPEARPP